MTETERNGWYTLTPHCDLQIEHGVPVRIACEPGNVTANRPALAEDVQRYTGLHVELGPWQAGERGTTREAALQVAAEDFDDVLARYAHASAATYWDRYQQPVHARTLDDFETEAYALDFVTAMHHCGLDWRDVDKHAHSAGWQRALYSEAQRLAAYAELPAQP